MNRTRFIHYIYHLPGRKVGCTKDLSNRLALYKVEEGQIPPEVLILEKLPSTTIGEAGDREWWWADKLGYKRGIHYSTSVSTRASGRAKIDKEKKRIACQNTGRKTASKPDAIWRTWTPEQRSQSGRKGGIRTAALGLSGLKTMSLEVTIERNRRTGKRMADEKNTPAFRPGECPHCGKRSANGMVLHRWHFDHCPKNPERTSAPKKFEKHSEESIEKIRKKVRESWVLRRARKQKGDLPMGDQVFQIHHPGYEFEKTVKG